MGAVEAPPDPTSNSWSARVARPSFAGAVGLFVITAGWIIGLRPLADNSFLTHLATGRLILEEGRVPSADPYTFTAAGEPWVVQSWLVSAAYAGAERLGGLDAVRLLNGLIVAAVAGVGWSLLKPIDGILVRLTAAAVFLTVGGELWAERPFMVGLLAFGLTLLAIEDRLDPRWLVPIGWVWVNSHGSFPLGIVLIVVAAVGARLDGRIPTVELRCLRWGGLGLLLGAAGPLGPRVLWFPLELLQKQDVLRTVVEWRAPLFDSISQRMFILQLVLVLVVLVRKPSYRGSLLVAAFTAAALLGARNLPLASLVMLPVVAPALTGLGTLAGRERRRVARIVGAGAVAIGLLLTVVRLDQASLSLRKYPTGPLAYLESSGVDTREVRLAAPDFVGNLMDYVYGPERRTFYDDRFDMFPGDASRAHTALLQGTASLRTRLDRFDVDLVTVRGASPTGQVLSTDPSWRVLFLDGEWLLVCRRGVKLSASLGTC